MSSVHYTPDDLPHEREEFESMLCNLMRLRFPGDERWNSLPLKRLISLLEAKGVINHMLAPDVWHLFHIFTDPAEARDIDADMEYINSRYIEIMDSLHHARFGKNEPHLSMGAD